jgi:hypothetical protein
MKSRAPKSRGDEQPRVASDSEVEVFGSSINEIFSTQSLILGEDDQAFETLKAAIASAIKPQDTIEEMWVRDIAELMWESQRLRTLKANILLIAQKSALVHLIHLIEKRESLAIEDHYGAEILASGWLANDRKAVSEVREILNTHGFSDDTIMAQALLDKLQEVERIDRMIASADARRNRALAELERRREMRLRRQRTPAGEVTDIG